MAFFHGIETVNVPSSTQPAAAVETAVIGLVGVAPQGAVNTMTLCASEQDDEIFGGNLYPMTINRSLDHIRREDPAAKVIVVNVYDPSTTSTTITQEAITIANGKATLDYPVLTEAATPVVAGGSPWATFVEGTDYTISEYGVVTIIPSGDIAEGDTIYVTYDTFDVSGLAAADFVGATSPSKTGFKLFDEAYDAFGFAPKIFICPEYSSLDVVANEMETQSDSFRARCYVDDVNNTSRADLISNRTTAGNSFATTSSRVIPCGPWIQDYDYLGVFADYPLSAVAAGIHSRVARTEGYWVSPSNQVSNVIVKPEYPMAGTGPNDETGDVQLLNAAGIFSIVKHAGSYITYGNRNALYPSSSAPEQFIAVQYLDDIVSETLEKTLIPFIDRPLIQATIDAIKSTAQAYIDSLIQDKALLPGSRIYYDANDNPAVDLAAGKIVFRRVYAGAVPGERITFKSTFDINLLTQLS